MTEELKVILAVTLGIRHTKLLIPRGETTTRKIQTKKNGVGAAKYVMRSSGGMCLHAFALDKQSCELH